MQTFPKSTLSQMLSFYNGKAIKPGGEGKYPVYGSNGVIGGCDEFKYSDGIIVGRVGAYCGSVQYCPGKFWASDNTIVVKPQNANFDVRFLYYLLSDLNLNNYAGGAAQPLVTQTVLKQVEAYSPPHETQRKIASILSAYDDLIENNTRRIKILEEIAQALYREWFVNFRFPGHEQVKMVDSSLGMVPEGWSVASLQDVCHRITDGAHKSPTTQNEGYPMASVKDMHNYGLDLQSCRKISEDDFIDLVRNDCKVKKGDVLIAKDGSYLKHCFVVENDLDVVLLSSIAMLRPNKRIRPHLLAFILKDPVVKERMKGFVSGVAIPRIVLKDFRGFQIVCPPSNLQEQWGILAEPMIMQCWRLTAKNQNLRETRDLLLPKLIAGEVDVSKLEICVGAA